MAQVYNSLEQLPPDFSLRTLREMAYPNRVLMCPPDFFDVIDVKNTFMADQIGRVDVSLARQQWDSLKETFSRIGLQVETISPIEGCEDMVFCANQSFPGLDQDGNRLLVLSQMKYPSRQKEVPAYGAWFASKGYRVESLEDSSLLFEGEGDALWHPGRGLIWGGYGHRSDLGVYDFLSKHFDVPVVPLQLVTNDFYHLDTCFCLLDEQTVLIHSPAISESGVALVRRVFSRVIEVNRSEALENMACNASAFLGRYVVLQKGSQEVNRALKENGFEVVEVETSEFMKSGGSVFCMKMAWF